MLISAVCRKQDGEDKELNLLESRVRDINCGGLEIMMQQEVLEF